MDVINATPIHRTHTSSSLVIFEISKPLICLINENPDHFLCQNAIVFPALCANRYALCHIIFLSLYLLTSIF